MKQRYPELQAAQESVMEMLLMLDKENAQRIEDLWDGLSDEELIFNLTNMQNLYFAPNAYPSKQTLDKIIKKRRIITQEKFIFYDQTDEDGVGYLGSRDNTCYILTVRRNQQITSKESVVATKAEIRDVTNQVAGTDKKGQYSDTEISVAVAHGAHAINKELLGAASHDMKAKSIYREKLSMNGEVSLTDLPNEPQNKKSLILIDEVLKMMGFDSDLVTTPMGKIR